MPNPGEAVNEFERVPETLEAKVARILEEARKRVAPIVEREKYTEDVGPIMDFRMRGKGWSVDGTFNWLVERSNALGEIEGLMERALGQSEEVKP